MVDQIPPQETLFGLDCRGTHWGDPSGNWRDWYAYLTCLLAELNDATFAHVDLSFTGFDEETNYTIAYFITVLWAECLAFYLSYKLFDLVWADFRAISPSHKKWYVVANVWKSLLLGLMTFSGPYWYYTKKQTMDGEYNMHKFQSQLNKFTIINYSMTDVVALIMVPKLPMSTIIHHWTSLLFTVLLCTQDIASSETLQMIVLYGTFSTIAFSTNLYLSLRVMYQEKPLMRLLAIVSFIVYALACAANWTWHTVWIVRGLYRGSVGLWGLLYYCALASVVQDDVKLLQWLLERSLNRPTEKPTKAE